MAPAAADTISRFFTDTGYHPEDFDLVVTGDLAHVGSQLLLQLLSGGAHGLKPTAVQIHGILQHHHIHL